MKFINRIKNCDFNDATLWWWKKMIIVNKILWLLSLWILKYYSIIQIQIWFFIFIYSNTLCLNRFKYIYIQLFRIVNTDFICDFDDFVDLSIVVFSIAINNIKKRWIIIDFDELWDEIVDWKKVTLDQVNHNRRWWWDSCCSLEEELTNQSVRKSICGWKLRIWLATMAFK